MNRWTASALLLFVAALMAGCGNNNSTKAGITITAASTTTGANSVTVPVGGTEQFGATVTGISVTTVYWQVCLPVPVSKFQIPTKCTAIPGVTARPGTTILTGYGSINQSGFYTAPSQIPNPNSFVILATSPIDTTAFATFTVTIDSGIRVQVTPSAVTIGAGETQQFTATVTGTSNTSVTWQVNGEAGGDPNNGGTITPGGLYTSPANATGGATIKAISGADGGTSGTATVTIVTASPTLSGIEPQVTEQGAAQQEVYLSGANFTSNGSVLVNGNAVPYVFVSTSLVRAIIPASALTAAGTASVEFQFQPIPPQIGELSNAESLAVVPVRPAIVAYSPQAFTSTPAASTLSLTGGFFLQGPSAQTTVQFDGGKEGAAVPSTIDTAHASQRLGVTLPANALSVPGLYALTAQNPGIAVGQPSMSAVNIAVTPTAAMIPGSATPDAISLGGGTQPAAIAMDLADGIAVVAEKGANAVALVDVSSRTVIATIPVGNAPTGVAVDDLLPDPLALVVNSGDNTVSVIDLKTKAPAAAPINPLISLMAFTPQLSAPSSIAINPQTHRAIVANTSTNLATVIDLVNPFGSCKAAPCPLTTVGGTSTSFSTGGSPAIGIDPGLNWAVVTPGGAGSINIVDLGYGSPSPGGNGRAPAVIGSLSLSTTVQGVGVNAETHEALFTDFNTGNVTEYSLLDNGVNPVANFGAALTTPKESAAAVNPLENVGIAINSLGTGTASIVDLGNHDVIQTVTNLTASGGTPNAVTFDPATNSALITNSASGTISVVPLGAASPKPLQIAESSPAVTFSSSNPLSLTVNGMGLAAGSAVLLDGTPLATATVVSSRQIQATVPATLLASARRFAVQVQNTDGTVSNVEPLTVIQAVTVGTSPAGVAVDPNRDAAVVTNSGSGNISIVSVAPPSAASPQSLGAVGVIGSPLAAHLNPRGVAVDARLGLAVAANFDSDDLSLIDYSNVNTAVPYSLPAVPGCASGTVCIGPAGVAFNQDTNGFIVTDTNIGTASSDVSFGAVIAPTTTAAAQISRPGTPQPVDQTPGDLAIAPSFDPFDLVNNPNTSLTYAAIASAGQTSVIDFLNTTSEFVVGRTSGLVQPAGIVYDSLNHVFLASDSLNNNLVIVDPLTFVPVFVRAGFNPTSLAYDSQTSTIAVVNGATGTLSVLDYVCPPLAGQTLCTSPHVRSTMGLIGSQISPTAPLGPKTIDVDPLTNLAVVVDSENNRVLLVPLPN